MPAWDIGVGLIGVGVGVGVAVWEHGVGVGWQVLSACMSQWGMSGHATRLPGIPEPVQVPSVQSPVPPCLGDICPTCPSHLPTLVVCLPVCLAHGRWEVGVLMGWLGCCPCCPKWVVYWENSPSCPRTHIQGGRGHTMNREGVRPATRSASMLGRYVSVRSESCPVCLQGIVRCVGKG